MKIGLPHVNILLKCAIPYPTAEKTGNSRGVRGQSSLIFQRVKMPFPIQIKYFVFRLEIPDWWGIPFDNSLRGVGMDLFW